MSIGQLEDEIEATRAELNATLAALQARLSPRQRLTNLWHATQERRTQFAGHAERWVRDKPYMALGIMIGIGLAAGLGWSSRLQGRRHCGW